MRLITVADLLEHAAAGQVPDIGSHRPARTRLERTCVLASLVDNKDRWLGYRGRLHAVLGHHSPMGYELRTAGNAPGRIINWSGKPGQPQ